LFLQEKEFQWDFLGKEKIKEGFSKEVWNFALGRSFRCKNVWNEKSKISLGIKFRGEMCEKDVPSNKWGLLGKWKPFFWFWKKGN